jgi:uncharacterized RDD family membrane protein YckC
MNLKFNIYLGVGMKNRIIIGLYVLLTLFGASLLYASFEIHCPPSEALMQRSSAQGPWKTTFAQTIGPAGATIEVSQEDVTPQRPWTLIKAQLINTAPLTQILDCVYQGTSLLKGNKTSTLWRNPIFKQNFSLSGVINSGNCTMPEKPMAKYIVCN